MDLHAWLRLIAGTVVIVSVGLSVAISPFFLLLTLFVGLNLVQSALSGWCPMMSLLRRLGVRET